MPGNISFAQAIHSKKQRRVKILENSQMQSNWAVCGWTFDLHTTGSTFPSEHTKLKSTILLDEIHTALTKAGEKGGDSGQREIKKSLIEHHPYLALPVFTLHVCSATIIAKAKQTLKYW